MVALARYFDINLAHLAKTATRLSLKLPVVCGKQNELELKLL